jgi:transposase-like protein
MGKVTRKRHTAEFKARVALEAVKGEQTLAEIAAKHGIGFLCSKVRKATWPCLEKL